MGRGIKIASANTPSSNEPAKDIQRNRELNYVLAVGVVCGNPTNILVIIIPSNFSASIIIPKLKRNI